MDVFVCLDDRNGMLFNHRRQSRDREVIRDVLGGPALLHSPSQTFQAVLTGWTYPDEFQVV